MTIFTTGGLILYQYTAQPSLFKEADGTAFTCKILNGELIQKLLSVGNTTNKTYRIVEGITLLWRKVRNYYVVAIYPDILFEGPRQYLKTWATSLVEQTVNEYDRYYTERTTNSNSSNSISNNNNPSNSIQSLRPDPTSFEPIFQALLHTSKTQKQPTTTAAATTTTTSTTIAATKTNKPGKEMRSWGDAKVTDSAMAALDKSQLESVNDKNITKEDATKIAQERAVQEAREIYLPSAEEIASEGSIEIQFMHTGTATTNDDSNKDNNHWSSTITGLFQQMTGNKVLQSSDLDLPLEKMEKILIEKNVAGSIAQDLCESVRCQLIGKRLNSMYRVESAVRQALESTLTKVLKRDTVDLLRNVVQKRGDTDLLSRLSLTRNSHKRRPYVITVMGINGIGKTTSLAKLAYYFQQHDCSPLLVAGDTFRSGAVEQLQVHADCLNVPLFAQGYSKDPSAVTKAAIEHATVHGKDVVLVDTAGRMQNNVPLMKSLGKLVLENQPDFCILVVEALVGHDGLSQYEMFQQSMQRPIDGLILTKFDTVDQKVGAALTLTQETGAPIVFLGVGQKYHHFKKINVTTVVQSLFS